MANEVEYTYAAAGTRTVQPKDGWADKIIRVSIEETPLLSRLARRGLKDIHPQIQEDDLQAIDTGNAHAEGAVAPAASSTARSTNDNYMQTFRKTAEVTTIQANTAYYGHSGELAYQLALRGLELKRDIEAQIIGDQAQQAPTPVNGRVGKMKGMGAIITTNTDAVGDFNQVNLEALVRAAHITSGGDPSECWMDGTRKNAVAAWTEQVTRYTTDKATIYNNVQVFESNIGLQLNFHLHRYMPQNIAGTGAVFFALDFVKSGWELIEQVPLNVKVLPFTGGKESRQIEWVCTILCGAEKANFAFVGV